MRFRSIQGVGRHTTLLMFLSRIGVATLTRAAALRSGTGASFIFSHSRQRLRQITFFPSLHALLLFRLPGPPATARTTARLHASSVWGSEVRRSCCSSKVTALRPGWPPLFFLLKFAAAAPASPTSWSLVAAVHCRIFKSGSLDDVFVATALVGSLARCSDLEGALKMFVGMSERDVAAWNAFLSGISQTGNAQHALVMFRRMLLAAMPPNSVTLSIILQVCTNLNDMILGRCVHSYLLRRPGVGDSFVHNSLLVYYTRIGDVNIAMKLFERMETRAVVSWNVMISGYVMNDRPWEALEIFHHMRQEGPSADLVTLETVLQACANVGEEAFKDGESTHSLLIRLGFTMNVFTENSLLLMYSKCREVHRAQHLFDNMASRNIVSWNILIDMYVEKHCPERALALFKSAQFTLPEVASDLVVSGLKAVKMLSECHRLVMCFHCLVILLGFTSDEYIIGSLVSSYGESMDVELAKNCFDYFLCRNSTTTVLWNTMLSVYLHNGCLLEAAGILHSMQTNHSKTDPITLVNAFSVAARLPDVKLGQAVHAYIIRNAFEANIFVSTSLLEFYCKSGMLCRACWLFVNMPQKTIASWNVMIFGCLQNDSPRVSLSLFHSMQVLDVRVDATTVVGVIEAITCRGQEREGDYIHRYAIQRGLGKNEYVANSLINMYSRFGDLGKVQLVFDGVTGCSKIMWNVLIAEYSFHCMSEQAIFAFHLMKLNNMCPNAISLLSVLPTCSHLASLNCAMWIHTNVIKSGCGSDVFVKTSLLDAYAKCGQLDVARLIFNNMRSKTAATWNSIIRAYGMHGRVEEADKHFSEMQRIGIEPDLVTFLVLMSACGHAGEVEKGLDYFNLMTRVYSLSPRIEHYSCIVDLLGRSGLINEAFEFHEQVPQSPMKCGWGSLLGACRVQGKMEQALVAAKKLFDLDPMNYGYHVLLSNVLADAGMWTDACEIKRKVKAMEHKKVQGLSMCGI